MKELSRKEIKIAVITGANRVGKTELETTDCALYAECRHPYEHTPKRANIWFSVTDYKKVTDPIWPQLRVKLRPGTYIPNMQRGMVTITKGPGKGNKIMFKSTEQGLMSYESSKVHRVYVDEPHPIQYFNALITRTTDTGGKIMVGATLVNGTDNPDEAYLFEEYIRPFLAKQRDDIFVYLGTWKENSTLDEAAVMRNRAEIARTNPLEARIRFDGELLPLGGSQLFSFTEMEKSFRAATDGDLLEV